MDPTSLAIDVLGMETLDCRIQCLQSSNILVYARLARHAYLWSHETKLYRDETLEPAAESRKLRFLSTLDLQNNVLSTAPIDMLYQRNRIKSNTKVPAETAASSTSPSTPRP